MAGKQSVIAVVQMPISMETTLGLFQKPIKINGLSNVTTALDETAPFQGI
jgi:hypothetical protein